MDEGEPQKGAEPVVVAGRYEIERLLACGGTSLVHVATDRVSGRRVAVKLLQAGPQTTPPRVRREVTALRLLRLPGVVPLVDQGIHEGTPFLVMDLIEGEPFPGPLDVTDWDAIAPVTLSLLEILARVHAAGVIHRDMKPNNVFVDAQMRVTVLDFGLSWGPALGAALTKPGSIVGTPEYLAPEQILGRPADARTDLYALGVMLYEILSGRLPHDAPTFSELIALKRSSAPMALRHAAPEVPLEVALVIDQLLSIDPGKRPRSAGETIQRLFGDAPPQTSPDLPRLGDTAVVDDLVEKAVAGTSTDIAGPRGSGRTRLLSDVSDRLKERGVSCHWIVPGSPPYSSLAKLLGGFDDLADAGRDDAFAVIQERLEERLAGGAVLLVDDIDRVDHWSAMAIHRARGAGCVLRAVNETDDGVQLGELSEAALRPLFKGPDRIFHLREDGARELWRRTGGLPSRVAAEIAAWIRAGLAHWEDDLLVVSRDALNQLRGGLPVSESLLVQAGSGGSRSAHLDQLLAWIALAWPHSTSEVLAQVSREPAWRLDPELDALEQERLIRRLSDGRIQPLIVPHSLQSWPEDERRAAHHALADALPPGTAARLRHLAAAGEPLEVVEEALLVAPELTRKGETADALVVLEQALVAARDAGSTDAERRTLYEYAKACLVGATPRSVDRALYEVGRSNCDTEQLSTLLRGARLAVSGEPESAMRVASELGTLDDHDLELWRQATRVRASRLLSPDAGTELLDEIEVWAESTGEPRAVSSALSWRALELQTRGEHEKAAELHLEAAARSDRAAAKTVSYINAAYALMQAGAVAKALGAAADAARSAASCRSTVYEAHAEWIRRSMRYRMEEPLECDRDLVEAVAVIGDPNLEALVCLTEAAVSWRHDDLGTARDLGERAAGLARTAGNTRLALLARALVAAAGATVAADEFQRLSREASDCSSAEIAVEALGLLARAPGADGEALRSIARRRAEELPPAALDRRGDVLAPREAL